MANENVEVVIIEDKSGITLVSNKAQPIDHTSKNVIWIQS